MSKKNLRNSDLGLHFQHFYGDVLARKDAILNLRGDNLSYKTLRVQYVVLTFSMLSVRGETIEVSLHLEASLC